VSRLVGGNRGHRADLFVRIGVAGDKQYGNIAGLGEMKLLIMSTVGAFAVEEKLVVGKFGV